MRGIIATIWLVTLLPVDVLGKCKVKYDDNGIASSRYFKVSTWSTGAVFRFSKYGANDYLFDVRLNKGAFPWRRAEFNTDSWVRMRFVDDEITLSLLDFKKAVRVNKFSVPWHTYTESRYVLSGDLVSRIANQGATSIEVRALDPNGEEHTTSFEMKPKWIKDMKERANCIGGAEARIEELTTR